MNADTARLLSAVALGDLLVGLVLAAIGVVQDSQALSIAGVLLLVSGGPMLGWVTITRGRPTNL